VGEGTCEWRGSYHSEAPSVGKFSQVAWEDKPVSVLVGIVMLVFILWAIRAVIKFY
jgi:hypothetical protein